MPGYPGMPGYGPPGAPAGAEAKPAPGLPEDVADWVKDHYYKARWDGDPRLKIAVVQMAKRFAGSSSAETRERAATLVTRLLKSEQPKPPEPPKPAAPSGPSGMPGYGPPGGMPGYGPSGGTPPSYGPPGGTPSPESPEMTPGMPDYTGYPGYPGAPGGPGGGGQPRPLDADTTRAMVQALGILHATKTAQETVRELLAGTLKVDDDRTAAETALAVLLEHPFPNNEDVFYTILTTPEQIRQAPKPSAKEGAKTGQPGYPGGMPPGYPGAPPGTMPPGYPGARSGETPPGYPGAPSGEMPPGYPGSTPGMPYGYPGSGGAAGPRLTAADLQTKALALAATKASEALRARLARFVVSPAASVQTRNLLAQLLLQPVPENLSAQMILHAQRGEAFETARGIIRQHFTRYSSEGLAALMGVPAPKGETPAKPGGRGYPGYPGGMPPGYPTGPAPGYPGGMPPGYPGAPEAPSEVSPDAPGPAPGMPPGAPGTMPGYPGMAGPGKMPAPIFTAPETAKPGAAGRPKGLLGLLGGIQTVSGEDQALNMVRQLWGSSFVQSVESALELPSDEPLSSVADQVVLASTIPLDSVRAKVCQLLHERAEDGPGDLESAGLVGRYFTDPGLLVVLKTLPRKDPPDPTKLMPRRPSPYRRGPGGPGQPGYGGPSGGPGAQPGARGPGGPEMPGGPPGAPGQKPDKTSPEQAAYEWMATCESLARAMCANFYAAAKAGKSRSSSTEESPFPLTPAMRPVAEYHFAWPEDLPQRKLSGVTLDPMKVHYVRLERLAVPNKVLDYFKRQFPRPVEHVSATGFWLEGSRVDAETGRKVSWDLLISKRTAAAKDQKGRTKPGTPYAMPGMPEAPGFTPPGEAGAGTPPSYGAPGYGMPGGYPGQPGGPAGERLDRNAEDNLVIELLAVEINAPDSAVKSAGKGKKRSGKGEDFE